MNTGKYQFLGDDGQEINAIVNTPHYIATYTKGFEILG